MKAFSLNAMPERQGAIADRAGRPGVRPSGMNENA
jgi:hypothetical protein